MSLYRKYRPKIFADVYGQEHIISTLENATNGDKLAHAYLFAGSRGTGKTSVARILAKIIMTKNIEDAAIKKQIESAVDEGNLVDLLEIDAASNRGIDDVRDIIEKIQFSPVVASAKVYIIDEVHMLTKEAFNALLKTLEEPPRYAYFILATTELNKIPVTVQSRCQCFPFRHIREEDIVRRLQYIADQEHIKIEREALRSIAHVSEGGMRDAISLLDQMRSLENITLDDVAQRTGVTGQAFVEDVITALHQKDRNALLKSIAKVEEAGVPLDVFARQMLRLVRNTIHTAVKEKQPTNDLISLQGSLLDAIRDIRISPVPGLVLEAALLSLCEESGSATAPMPKIVVPKNEVTEVTEVIEVSEGAEVIKDALIQAPDLTIESVQKSWPNIVNQASPASVKMSLKNGRVTQFDGTKIILTFSSAFHRDKIRETESSRSVEEILEKIFKAQLRLECELENGTSTNEAPSTVVSEDMVNMADAAAEIF
ncbi:MAG: DNA polymerase III subunit gamma/tau [bacterium]|nr:DNA polymerase III subunit gamma/tau [bacterium]MDA1292605.1 DNA polymerase III subunit gamma/tau [bacterium]